MAKLLKIVARWIGGIVEWLLIILITIAFAVRTSPVQTYLAGLATDFLSKELHTELRIGKVDIFFFDRVALEEVFVRDQQGDTLASLGSIEVVLRSLNLRSNKMTLRNVGLYDGKVGVSRDSIKGDYNYWFITDYFSSGSKSPDSKPMALTVRSLDIEHVDIKYDDYRKSYSDYGMDYDHLDFDDVVLHADEFTSRDNEFNFILQHLSVKEKCGLVLKRLKARAKINDTGIYLSEVKINTSRSRLFANHFYMKMNGLRSVHTFEDSVTFDARIDSSRVSLTDISYFAPALEGMYQTVFLEAGLKQKVKNLRILDIDLRTGKRSIIRGDLLLPDFRNVDQSFLKENIQYAFIDLEDLKALRLPDDAVQRFVELDPMISRLGYFEAKKLDLTGYWTQFVMSSRQVSTALGTLHLDNGLLFTQLNEGGYSFERSANSNYDVYIDSFQLGKFIDDPLFGKVNGALFMSGVVGQKDIIRINKLDGEINRFGFNDYNYSNIVVREGSFINNIFEAGIDVNDPHLELTYDGYVDLNDGYAYNFNVSKLKADLGQLHFTNNPNTNLVTGFKMDMRGKNLSTYEGTIGLELFNYQEDSNEIDIPQLNMELTRGVNDRIRVTSNVADVEVTGKVNPNLIVTSLNNALSGILSAFFQFKPIPRKTTDSNHFDLIVNVKNASEVLAVFAPDLYVESGTMFSMHYNARERQSEISLNSGEIIYDSIVVDNLKLGQSIIDGKSVTNIDAGLLSFNDSLYVNNVDVDIDGTDNVFESVVAWNQEIQNPSKFKWKTTFAENNRIQLIVRRDSYFSVKNQKWEIMNSSELVYSENKLDIDHLVMERDEQFVAINGVLSDSIGDAVLINVNQLHLGDFSSFIDPGIQLEGNVSGDISVRTPFTTFRAEGDLLTEGLVINNEPIGDVAVNGLWDNDQERMVLSGDLKYLKNETFDFTGYYYPYKDVSNIDFILDFNGMDLQFANAFVDPTIVRDIRGKLKGEILLTGNIESPDIDGKLRLDNGNVRIDLLGVNYKLSGPIEFDGESSGFFINNMPMQDEEGNKAFMNASIFHSDYADWNCDININMEDDYTHLNPITKQPALLDKFLVLNTTYKEGDIYYGRAYATGTVNIFVTDESTDITVNAKTAEGTRIDLPMYGNSELEQGNYITFDSVKPPNSPGDLDLTGLNLDMNFIITPAAQVKLIFNEKTEDQIVAFGRSNDLHIGLDEMNDIKMSGRYEIYSGGKADKKSVYNFAYGPIKQPFTIEEGGTISWTGDPYNAILDLNAHKKVYADLNEIMPDVIENGGSGNQEVYCNMIITQTLLDPLITLDIEAPKASESGKAILASIHQDKDELQKQFFSLLLFNKFVPLGGQTTGGAGGLADVLATQINSLLSGLSDEVKLNVEYDGDQTTGQKKYAVGGQYAIGQNQNFILKGTFGVANTASGESQAQTTLIGDMSLEYLINEDGTFRVNIFNESNDNSVIQDKTNGLFTQGVGLHYQEEFNTAEDFKLLQVLLDLFRNEKRVKIKKRRREVSIHDEDPGGRNKVPAETQQALPAEGTTPETETKEEGSGN